MMNEAVSKVVDGFMRSKSRDAIVVCVLFGLGWMLSPFMALCAAGLYFKLMKKQRSFVEGRVDRGQVTGVSHFQAEYQPVKKKIELIDIAIIVGIAMYCVCPLDGEIFLGPFGWIDDAALVAWAWKHFSKKWSSKTLPPEPPVSPQDNRPHVDQYGGRRYDGHVNYPPPARPDDAIDVEWRRSR